MSSADQEFVELDITVDQNELVKGVGQVLSAIRPQWPSGEIRHSIFKDGITNKLVGVYLEGNEGDMILVRIYGENTDRIIDRSAEIKNIKVLETVEFAPRLYASFNNGIAYQFLPGDTLNVETCRKEKIYSLVAQRMAKLHQQLGYWTRKSLTNGCYGNPKVFLWDKIELFLSLVPETFEDAEKEIRIREHLPSKRDLRKEFQWLKEKLELLGNEVVFSHNDLLLANILFDEEKHSIHFIDLEYAAPNYQAYDIANHFCEFAGVDTVDHSLYPDEDFRRKWITVYLKAFHQRDDINETDVKRLVDQVEKFSVAAHFFWGVWALIQAANSTIPFDFIGYSISRLEQYFSKKSVLD